MIKTGAFFNSIGRDAIILEYILGLKRSCFAKGLCKVGFPVKYFKNNLDILSPITEQPLFLTYKSVKMQTAIFFGFVSKMFSSIIILINCI